MKTLALVLALLLVPRVAAAADCTRDVPIAGAIATVHRTQDAVVWDASYVVDLEAVVNFAGGRIPFAVPLAPGETMQNTRNVTPIIEGDRITGLCVDPGALDGRTIRASFTEPPSAKLGAPIAAGNAVQIIDAADSEDLRVDGSLEPHVGFLAARGIGHDAREEARRLTNAPSLLGRTFVYVRGTDVRAAGGLDGKLGARARARSSVIGAAFSFLGVVGLLVFAARRLRRAAVVERADALLAGEIDAADARTSRRA